MYLISSNGGDRFLFADILQRHDARSALSVLALQAPSGKYVVCTYLDA